MAAHEVLKPLVMTEAFATMIAERGGHGLDLDTRRDVDTLIRISSRMRVLVEAMLMDARPDQEPLPRQAVDVSKVLNDCVEMLGAEIRAREVKVDVEPMPVVPGDEALLTGVFGNLLSNALQYGPREGGEIQISAERSEAGWTFSVESPGPADPRARPPAHLRAVAARLGRAPQQGRRPRPRDRPPGGRAPRRAGRRHVAAQHGGEPLLLHAAGLTRERQAGGSERIRWAIATASSRERASSLRRMFFTCERTVSDESTSSSAI